MKQLIRKLIVYQEKIHANKFINHKNKLSTTSITSLPRNFFSSLFSTLMITIPFTVFLNLSFFICFKIAIAYIDFHPTPLYVPDNSNFETLIFILNTNPIILAYDSFLSATSSFPL